MPQPQDGPEVVQDNDFWLTVQKGEAKATLSKLSGRISCVASKDSWDDLDTALKFLREQSIPPVVIDG